MTIVNAGEPVEQAYAQTPSGGTMLLKRGVHVYADDTFYLNNNGKQNVTIEFEDGAILDGREKALKFFEARASGLRVVNGTIRNFLEDGIFWGSGGLTGCELVECLIERIGNGVGKSQWGGWMIKQHWGSYFSAGGTSASPIKLTRCIIQDVRHGGFQTYSGTVHAVLKDCIIRRVGGRAQVAWKPFPDVFPAGHPSAGKKTNDYAVGFLVYSGLGSLVLENCLVHDVGKVGSNQLAPWCDVRQGAVIRDVRWWNAAPKVGGGGSFSNVVEGQGGFVKPVSGPVGPGGSAPAPPPPPPPPPEPDPEPDPEPTPEPTPEPGETLEQFKARLADRMVQFRQRKRGKNAHNLSAALEQELRR